MIDDIKPELPPPDEWACINGVSQAIYTADTLRAAVAAAVAAERPISGALLRSLFDSAPVPLRDMTGEDEIASWWKHFAGRVRNASRATAPKGQTPNETEGMTR